MYPLAFFSFLRLFFVLLFPFVFLPAFVTGQTAVGAPVTKRKKGYRVAAKRLFLTYPHCELSKEDALIQLRRVVSPALVESYVVARELHTDGTPHIHIYCALDTQLDKRGAKAFDLRKYDGTPQHGNYQGCAVPTLLPKGRRLYRVWTRRRRPKIRP